MFWIYSNDVANRTEKALNQRVTPDLSDLAFKTLIKTEDLNEKKQNIKEIINGIHQT